MGTDALPTEFRKERDLDSARGYNHCFIVVVVEFAVNQVLTSSIHLGMERRRFWI